MNLLPHKGHTFRSIYSYLLEHLFKVEDIKKFALSENRNPDIQAIFKPQYSPSYPVHRIYYINCNLGAEMIIRVW